MSDDARAALAKPATPEEAVDRALLHVLQWSDKQHAANWGVAGHVIRDVEQDGWRLVPADAVPVDAARRAALTSLRERVTGLPGYETEEEFATEGYIYDPAGVMRAAVLAEIDRALGEPD